MSRTNGCASWRGAATASVLAVGVLAPVTAAQTTTRQSIGANGEQGNGASTAPDLTPDGRFISFQSAASNLVAGDTNGALDVFVRDCNDGTIVRVSVSSSGEEGNAPSSQPAISDDGRSIAFASAASNLVDDDTNGVVDVFVHQLDTGTTRRVSVHDDGTEGNAASLGPTISGDGRLVAFFSRSSTLVDGDTNDCFDVFVHDLSTSRTTRISVAAGGVEANGHSSIARISRDGRFVVYTSGAWNLVAKDTNGRDDVVLCELATGTQVLISVSSSGEQGNEHSDGGEVAADGSLVVFSSTATNLDPADTTVHQDVFLRDLGAGETELLSVDANGASGDWHTGSPRITPDGRFVAFSSYAMNWFPGYDYPRQLRVFLVDRVAGTLQQVSDTHVLADDDAYSAVLPDDGRHVVFVSAATNLVPGDTNAAEDVFLRDMTVSIDDAWWAEYGAGFPGTLGIPTLRPAADPVLGTTLTFDLSNSAGVMTIAVALIGTAPASEPTRALGELLVVPSVVLLLVVPPGGLQCHESIPDDPAFVGAVVMLQGIELDEGAARRLSFTRGLHLALGR